MRNEISPFRSINSQDSEEKFPRYSDMRPVFGKTILFKDEENNLVISEENVHKMFVGLTRPDKDPT